MGVSRQAASILVLVPFGLGMQALGQTSTSPAQAPAASGAQRPGGPGLAIPELTDRLSREGYRDVREVERKSDKLYKVTARDAQGRSMELAVDARTAEVLSSEQDDDD
jgi:Peptidase propeptide and YPEB domain